MRRKEDVKRKSVGHKWLLQLQETSQLPRIQDNKRDGQGVKLKEDLKDDVGGSLRELVAE